MTVSAAGKTNFFIAKDIHLGIVTNKPDLACLGGGLNLASCCAAWYRTSWEIGLFWG
jgi:hypothetical protein